MAASLAATIMGTSTGYRSLLWNFELDSALIVGGDGGGNIEIGNQDLHLSLTRLYGEVVDTATHQRVVADLAMPAIAEDQDGAHDFLGRCCGGGCDGAFAVVLRDSFFVSAVLLLAPILRRISDQLIITPPLEDGEPRSFVVRWLLVVVGCGLRVVHSLGVVVVSVRVVVDGIAAKSQSAHPVSKPIVTEAIIPEAIAAEAIVVAELALLIEAAAKSSAEAANRNAWSPDADSATAFVEIDGARDADLGLQ